MDRTTRRRISQRPQQLNTTRPNAMRRTRQSFVLAFVFACVLLATLLGFHPSLSLAVDLEIQLQRLDDPSYVIRQDATHILLADESSPLDDLITLYAQAQSPEQRHRLTSILQHHLLRQIRLEQFPLDGPGSIGIRQKGLPAQDTWPQNNTPVIFVESTYPGFPAFAHLQPGDMILAVNNQSIANTDEPRIAESFGQMIQSHATGQRITLTLLRHEQPLTVSFTLANLDALQQIYTLNRATLRPPFNQRWLALKNHLGEIAPSSAPLPIARESFDVEEQR